MKWYTGTIAEAVAYSQTEKALFCVVILGNDAPSQELEASLNHNEVVSLISGNQKFVCVKLDDGTEEHQQFLQLYSNAKSPTIFCISAKGKAVEVITSPLNPEELRSKFESAWKLHQEIVGQSSQTPVASAMPQAPSRSETTSEVVQAEGDSEAEPSKSSLEERIERAKKLAAAKQQLKLAEEAEEQKRREKERREAGRSVAELKRWQEDEETKRLAEERRKDKKEDAILRQRLREQIAQDRIDRQLRNNPIAVDTIEERNPSSSNAKANEGSGSASDSPRNPGAASAKARLQFRLPTGSSQNHTFEPDATLGDVRQFLITNAVVPFRKFTISVAFPRREFTSSDYGATLRDLDLVPSATLLILPITGSGSSIIEIAGSAREGIAGILTAIIGLMLYPITIFLSFFRPALPDASSGKKESDSKKRPADIPSTSKGTGNVLGGGARGQAQQRSPDGPSSSGKSTKENRPKQSDDFGPDGNVHRLRSNESDSDDEQATWNGNSTQQM